VLFRLGLAGQRFHRHPQTTSITLSFEYHFVSLTTVSPRISVPTCLPHPYPDAARLGGSVPFNDSGVFIFDVFEADDSIHLLGFFEKRKFVLRTDYLCPVRNVPRALWKEICANKNQLKEWQDLSALGKDGAALCFRYLCGQPDGVSAARHGADSETDVVNREICQAICEEGRAVLSIAELGGELR
jgi:hypothetical protein